MVADATEGPRHDRRFGHRREAVVSTIHHQPVVSTVRHEPVVSTVRHQPVAATARHRPVTAAAEPVPPSGPPGLLHAPDVW